MAIRETVLKHIRSFENKRPLRIIPFLFTFANALFGFLSVIKTLDDQFVAAAWCIVLAAIMDLFDGRIARLLNSATYVGRELDSLCDAVSFCFAPAILMYSWSLFELGTMGLIILGLFLCCGLFRLARFNVLYANQTAYFIGLPTTIAAFFVAQMVIHEEWIAESIVYSTLRPERISFIVCTIALLMISSIKFPSAKYLQMRVAITGIISFISLLIVWAWTRGYPVFLFLASLYIVGGFLLGIVKEIIRPLLKRYGSRRLR
jgi:CDP-diacylglycerol--serine O-phosphatidyltransferase